MKPMAKTPPSDRSPERAALDELRKAFAVDEPDAAPAETADTDDSGDVTAPTPVGDPTDDASIDALLGPGEPTPGDRTGEAPAADETARVADDDAVVAGDDGDPSPPPRIIRIDDYAADPGAPQETTGDRHPGGTASGPNVPGEPAPPAPPAPATPDPAGDGGPHVISIEVDDLPDAVYVEGSLESGGAASIVFIEDDVEADALKPESDRDLRRGIEPRMRERRLAVKRAQGRKRLKWLIAAVVVVVIGVAALATFGSSLFAIRADQVTVTGNVYTDPERLQAVIDDLVGTPVLTADTQHAERELEAIPWVEDAKVTTRFPHAAKIEIRERQAVATFQGPDGKFRVLDSDGRVLDVIEGYPIAYVLITGPDPVDLEPAEVAPRGYQGAAELARNLTGTVRGHVERIEVTADGSRLVMFLDDGTEVYFGEARDLFAKLVRLETVLLQNPEREPGQIDVSTSQTTL